MKEGGGVLNGLVFQFLYFVQCGAFSECITLHLKLKDTQFNNYVQEETAISAFVFWLGFFCFVTKH